MSDAIDNTRPDSDLPCPIVAIGASAGGLEALQGLFQSAPTGHGAAYIVIQHLDPDHESLMADLLSRRTDMAVRQAEDGVEPEADTVYLIPPGRSMTIEDGKLRLEDFPLPRGVRRPIDTFFLSLADDIERGFACMVLSGTGSDGSRAFRAAKEAGGLTVVQDPATAKFDGMPQAAIETGFADAVLKPDEIAKKINDYFERLPARRGSGEDAVSGDGTLTSVMPEVYDILSGTVDHDFAGYKPATLLRRTQRRVHVTGADGPSDYLAKLRSDPDEPAALLREMLINVTNFFRDEAVFARLRRDVIPGIVARSAPERPIRVWVPGCSSGEEAYSLAMLLSEAVRERADSDSAFRRPQVQIFASDIDEQMLGVARAARYPLDALEQIPEPFRTRCTIAQETGFVISPHVRDTVRFSAHSVIKDPPFTRLDLISCRNLLIYFGADLQERVMPLFHYSLRQDGVLVLGTSEGLGRHTALFTLIDPRLRIFKRNDGRGRMPSMPKRRADEGGAQDAGNAFAYEAAQPVRALSTAAARVLERFAPAYMVIDRAGGIVTSSGRLTKYTEIPGGALTNDAVAMARPGLRAPLRRVLRRLGDGEKRAAVPDVEVSSEVGVQTVDISAERLPDGNYLVVLRDTGELRAPDEDAYETVPDQTEDVEDELRAVRFRLRTTVEELEAANEELKSSNEEMMSMNEELQSANEELSTVNDELKSKIDEVASANADLRNFLESSDIPTVILGPELEVRIFTPKAREVFPLREGDVGRALSDVRTEVDDPAMIDDARKVLEGGPGITREVATPDGARAYLMQITPYDTQEGEVDGVILSFTEITALKDAQISIGTQKERLDLAMQAANLGVWEYWPDTGAVSLDAQSRAFFGLPPAPAEVSFDDVAAAIDAGALPAVTDALEGAISGDGLYEATFPVHHRGGRSLMLYGIGRVHRGGGNRPMRFVGINRDVTEEHASAERSELMLRELNHRVKNMLSVITAMIRTSGRRAEDIQDFVAQCESRIAALSSAHTLLVQSDWAGADACELTATCLSVFDIQDRVDVDCARMDLPPMEAQAFSLVLHELATNALKHGALSAPGGRVDLRVDVPSVAEGAASRIRLRWTERGGPPVSEPEGRGFGTILLRDMIRHQHRGETTFDWRREGLAYTVEMDVDRAGRMEGQSEGQAKAKAQGAARP